MLIQFDVECQSNSINIVMAEHVKQNPNAKCAAQIVR